MSAHAPDSEAVFASLNADLWLKRAIVAGASRDVVAALRGVVAQVAAEGSEAVVIEHSAVIVGVAKRLCADARRDATMPRSDAATVLDVLRGLAPALRASLSAQLASSDNGRRGR